MNDIGAIGFDLFNTLITVEPHALDVALNRLMGSLDRDGLPVEESSFRRAHRDAAVRFLEHSRKDGRETHNRFWISAALETQGLRIDPSDPRVADSVDAYFSAFVEFCRPVPGTREMLTSLTGLYRLGLLSNFTHAPAAFEILRTLGLTPFFDVVVISGDVGYRKPHSRVFQLLAEGLGTERNRIVYVGDDPEPDITGARNAGLCPVWTTYVRDSGIDYAPGYSARGGEESDYGVPRVSNWDELLGLLRRGGVRCVSGNPSETAPRCPGEGGPVRHR